MTVKVQWLLEGHVIYFHFLGSLTVSEMQQAAGDALTLLRNYPHNKIHLLHDCRRMKSFPCVVQGIISAWIAALKQTNIGYVLSFAALDPASGWFWEMVTGFARIRYKHFETQGEALHFLQNYTFNLPQLPEPDTSLLIE
jgi:hypothetical protein